MALQEAFVEHPQDPKHGDYASSYALKLARATRGRPLDIARTLAELIPASPEIESITVAPPGFVNFKLKTDWLVSLVPSILSAGEKYGSVDTGRGSRVQVEFVSANPTGPLHVGNGRGAVLGSALSSVLAAAGYSVEKEYYVNDAGSQLDNFNRSLWARYCQALGQSGEIPENGYHGSYLIELAKEIIAEKGEGFLGMPESEGIARLGAIGVEKMIAAIRSDLEAIGVTFDVWFSERSLYDGGQFNKAMAVLHDGGYIGQKEHATWFMSTALGEDEDNVVIRSDGTPTYFGSDIAYHYNKFVERKFDRVINIWGADHQGHVPRMSFMMSALGLDPARLKIIISQLVTLRRGKEVVRLSKRTGDIITLREVVDEVGPDACRFFFLSRTADSQMDFDLELAKKQSADNPVYYVQYAHARISSILRFAKEQGVFDELDTKHLETIRYGLLTGASEVALVKLLLEFPETIESACSGFEPQRLTTYLHDVATAFHKFYHDYRVVIPEKELSAARCALCLATRTVLANGFKILGISAPEKM